MKSPISAFFSYSQGDRDVGRRLSEALRSTTVDPWTDDGIPAGADWGDHLRAAMDKADAVIFLVSNASLASASVMSEIGAAVASGKLIIPVVIAKKGLPAGLPAPLRNWQFLHAGDRDLDQVAREIRERLEHIPAAAD